MRRVVALLVSAILLLGGLRTYVYGDLPELSEASYDRPIRLEHYQLEARDPETPSSWSVGEHSPLEEPIRVPADFRSRIPDEGSPAAGQLSVYPRRGGTVRVLVLRYPRGEAPELPGADLALGEDRLVVSGDGELATVVQALREKHQRIKKVTVAVEKMKVLGNAYLKFSMELLIGLFFLITALILAKLLLIRRQLEG